mmetsp:Transcript_10728/g.19597  ORF Transcript_10728/g.19597 Transcript_10728/m.19597 type:complete len:228 (-) Transcript_10728:408-1091(-)|eukprot:CAMPEP_0175053032 /NCGR_PEP_ID=MMETSP0052_2-20121109/8694_1 /TAXON_ID=51329 ORGANISM="Polytomella parva, Strain SAG 63-3" /NCGR_SAMPLE_ID=MMETSP0052_2 /ASSEMBLY_ACC=CAM_ASM_000194 /LENGTH=227 /DNA_ID=CAMNT_0016317511 /DNA_START=53 /DNA_END=736 /DNA_ORIENTATION=-
MAEVTFESAMTRLKMVVYKNRIRVKEFLVDFDSLNTGYVFPNHFMSALSMAGLDKYLSVKELDIICDHYKILRTPTLTMVDHKTFLYDIEIIFTIPNLEKDPLVQVSAEPVELLDKTRYAKSSKALTEEEETLYRVVMERLASICKKRGQAVKNFFDDAAFNDHSVKLFGHVTAPQFHQVIKTKLEWAVNEPEFKVLVKKFSNEDKAEFVNYVAFSATVDPYVRVQA